MSARDDGLTDKFRVERVKSSSRGIDHSDCRYFVLDPQHDPLARAALRTYATAAGAAGYFQLRADIHSWLDRIEGKS